MKSKRLAYTGTAGGNVKNIGGNMNWVPYRTSFDSFLSSIIKVVPEGQRADIRNKAEGFYHASVQTVATATKGLLAPLDA